MIIVICLHALQFLRLFVDNEGQFYCEHFTILFAVCKLRCYCVVCMDYGYCLCVKVIIVIISSNGNLKLLFLISEIAKFNFLPTNEINS